MQTSRICKAPAQVCKIVRWDTVQQHTLPSIQSLWVLCAANARGLLLPNLQRDQCLKDLPKLVHPCANFTYASYVLPDFKNVSVAHLKVLSGGKGTVDPEPCKP